MKRVLFFGVVTVGAVAVAVWFIYQRAIIVDDKSSYYVTMERLTITSPAFKNNERIPAKYTCEDENINPPFEIANVPEEAKTLAFIFDDPDAVGGTWDHWVLWNIDVKTPEISENSVPAGAVQGKTSFGSNKYGGPCPPKGTGVHRYRFKLYALRTALNLPSEAQKKDVEKAMEGHIIDQAMLVGFYEKK